MTAEVLAAVPVLPAADVSVATDFYVTKLGFVLDFTHGEPAEYAGVSRDGAQIHLCRMDDAKAIGDQTMLRFRVRDIEALYEELKNSGALHPNGALQQKPWGTWEFTILDPNDVCVTFQESN